MDLKRLIDCYRCPLTFVPLYQGDIARDTIEALQDLDALSEDDGSDALMEVFGHLPEYDELEEIIESLEDALEMNKADMIHVIKGAIDVMTIKSEGYERTREYVEKDYLP